MRVDGIHVHLDEQDEVSGRLTERGDLPVLTLGRFPNTVGIWPKTAAQLILISEEAKRLADLARNAEDRRALAAERAELEQVAFRGPAPDVPMSPVELREDAHDDGLDGIDSVGQL